MVREVHHLSKERPPTPLAVERVEPKLICDIYSIYIYIYNMECIIFHAIYIYIYIYIYILEHANSYILTNVDITLSSKFWGNPLPPTDPVVSA